PGEAVVADDVGELELDPELEALAGAAEVERGRGDRPRVHGADRAVALAAGGARAPAVPRQRRVRLVGDGQVVDDRQRLEEARGVELHDPKVISGRARADVGDP